MGHRYDVMDCLRNHNERPVVEIDAKHKYLINMSKTNVLLITSEVKKAQKKTEDDPEFDIKMVDKIIQIVLGKETLGYINESSMTMAVTNDIMTAIMATIGDTEVDLDGGETPEEKKQTAGMISLKTGSWQSRPLLCNTPQRTCMTIRWTGSSLPRFQRVSCRAHLWAMLYPLEQRMTLIRWSTLAGNSTVSEMNGEISKPGERPRA